MSESRAIRSVQGQTLDMIAAREYDNPSSGVTALLQANPHLRRVGPILPIGSLVLIPELSSAPVEGQIRLWS